jgi:hypothetical protein
MTHYLQIEHFNNKTDPLTTNNKLVGVVSSNIIYNEQYFPSRKKMDEINEESPSTVMMSFEDCEMSSTIDEMCDLALKFLDQLRNDGTEEMKQINGLEALCQITSDVLSDGKLNKESNNVNTYL